MRFPTNRPMRYAYYAIGATLLLAATGARASAQVAKPAGLRATGSARTTSDSTGVVPTLVPPKIDMPAPSRPIPKPTDAPTARDRAGLARATRAVKQAAPRGTPASPGRRTPPVDD